MEFTLFRKSNLPETVGLFRVPSHGRETMALVRSHTIIRTKKNTRKTETDSGMVVSRRSATRLGGRRRGDLQVATNFRSPQQPVAATFRSPQACQPEGRRRRERRHLACRPEGRRYVPARGAKPVGRKADATSIRPAGAPVGSFRGQLLGLASIGQHGPDLPGTASCRFKSEVTTVR